MIEWKNLQDIATDYTYTSMLERGGVIDDEFVRNV